MTSYPTRRVEQTAEIILPRSATRPQLIWRARFTIIGVSLVVAALTYGISLVLPGTYSATSDVLVASTSSVTSVDSVNGANDLASQYAQFARTSVVTTDAAGRSGIPADRLAAGTTAVTLANTNIVRITVKADSADEASKGARAVSSALVAQTQKIFGSTGKSEQQQLADLDKLLAASQADVVRLTKALGAAAPGSSKAQAINTQLSNALQQITSLTLKRIDVVNQTSKGSTGAGVKLTALTVSPVADKVSPQPILYTIVALIASLVLVTELAVVSGRRKSGPIIHRRGSLVG
ncbi:Wzz/FepE/Etk N-terminal domain-containing protein [Actinoplanes sp. URMC 104]|uniref:Wzz/FepE/Etk N-terminal domain-containing protein n=1 Tax=Actinoplanes sp. URMC 104 TaxID=3423409 RepID=UPI003F1BAB81